MADQNLEITDLTKISVDFQLKFDELDAILLITTGGVGYLARAAYRHFETYQARNIEIQRKNVFAVIEEAKRKGASRLHIRVHPDVAVYAPDGGDLIYLSRTPQYDEIEITLGRTQLSLSD
jgi:hypothetical protein